MAGVIDLDDAIEDAAVLIQTPLRRVRRPDITPNNPPRRAASASAIAPASKRPRGEEPKPEPWRRSGSVPLDRQAFETGALALLLVSLEDRLMLPVPGFDGGPASPAGAFRNQQRCEGSVPVLDLHGVTPEGASVLLHVHGFRPYFYAQRPSEEVNLKVCLEALDRAVRSKDGGIELLEEVERTPIMNYQPNSERFIRVVMSSPKIQTNCKTALERGVPLGQGITWKSQAFEVVALQQRFLADLSGAGGAWLEAPAGRFRLRPQQHLPRSSLAQLEADTHYSCLQAHAPEGRWLQLAPLRLLSLHLRTREEGRICAAACVLRTHGFDSELSAAWAVAAGAEASAGGGATGGARMVGSEEELLQQLRDFLHAADPDIILGYDLLNGHLSSAITRAAALKLGAAPGNKGGGLCLGRLCGQPSRVKNSTFETRQLGKHETKDITAEGRLLFDLLRVTEMEHKLSSYTLSALALHFLKESRLELGAADLEKLSREDPRKLAEMTRRDAGLSMQLFYQQHCLFRYVEMARVTGVPMEYLLTRGQSVKVLSMLLRKARLHGYVLPPQTRYSNGMDEGGNTYEGGAVLDPLSGFYDEPVVTLDFASLYPSIMQKHNLCYSTIIRATAPPMMDGSESLEQVVPGLGHRFVSSKVRRGLVPMVLEELLTARARAKKELKQVPPGDTQLRAVLDGRQLALKISANSVYGFTGMANGPLPCQAIAASVTAYGRQMIETAKELVESHLCRAKGKAFDARVIYGDTDSVMMTLGSGGRASMAEAFDFGQEAARLVSEAFGAPVKMEFEKVYYPFLLMNKKRYAGLSFGSPEEKGKLDFKGIEVVRRDWCLLVRHLVEHSLQLLLRERSTERAVQYVRDTVTALRSGRVDFRLLVLSKALVKDGADAYAAKQPHVELVERIRKRDAGKVPKVGERVPYVYIAQAGKAAYEKSEDPLYALEAGLPLDADYYLDHQLKQPLLRVFEPVLANHEMKGSVENALFGSGGSSSMKKPSVASSGGGLSKFVQTKPRCIAGCGSFVDKSSDVLCKRCSADAGKQQEALLSLLEKLRPLEVETSEMLSQCLRCERGCGQLHVSCTNIDCPIFFRRRQAWQELQAAQESLRKLHLVAADW